MVGRPGAGKSHLATAISVSGITRPRRAVPIFYSTIDLVNALDQEKAQGEAGRIAASQQRRWTSSCWMSLDIFPSARRAGHCYYHLLSPLYERPSVTITTNLDFAEWSSVFGDAKMANCIARSPGCRRCRIVETGNGRHRFLHSSAVAKKRIRGARVGAPAAFRSGAGSRLSAAVAKTSTARCSTRPSTA